jgi:CheY-like chemotaxis protein
VSLLPSTLCNDIITDKHWFMENMLCLLSNAVKYSNKGVIRVTLDHIDQLPESDPPIIYRRDEESKQITEPTDMHPCPGYNPCILISVEDAGIGISEKERMDLFQPFKQVQRLAGGTGLGLYSLSSRIHALQGSRGVSARKDGKQGSTFWFAIPYRPDPNVQSNDDTPHTLPLPHLNSPSTQSSCSDMDTTSEDPCINLVETETEAVAVTNRRFLVVDDSPSILRVVSRVLTNKNYLVETADNGSAGLDLLIDQFESRHFDVVLMDLQMPVMDGIEAVRRYRDYESIQNKCLSQSLSHCESVTTDGSSTLEPFPSPTNSSHTTSTTTGRRLFIIGMSANSDGPTKQCALDAGMDSFLSKPFSIAELQPLIDRLSAA